MLGSLTKAIANFLESTDIVQQYNIPVYTANTAEDKFTVNTSLPAIIITVSPSDDPTVFISGNILDSFIINIRYLNDLLNYSFSDDNGIYEEMRDIPVKLRNELWDNRKSSYFKEFMNNLGLNIMYKGMSTYAHEAVYDNISKDLDIFSFTFSCNLFADLEYVENAILNSFNIVLDGMTYPDPNPPVSGIAYGSGRIFPIWNTVSGGEISYLSIHGGSIQNGTPTAENPVPILSCGDQGLSLILSDQQTGGEQNTLNISQAMQNAGHDGILRSVNGIYDEVFYDGKQWKLIQKFTNLIVPTQYGNVRNAFEDKVIFQVQISSNNYKYKLADSFPVLCDKFISASNIREDNIRNLNIGESYSLFIRAGISYIYFCLPPEYNTKELAIQYIGEANVVYKLYEPQEYSLDLPNIYAMNGNTYFSTLQYDIMPRMVCKCQSQNLLSYIKDGLIAYYSAFDRSNSDDNKNILPDLSGNNYDLTNYNMAYTPESGYGDGYIQYDGIDDFSALNNIGMEKIPITVLATLSDVNQKENSWSYSLSYDSLQIGIQNGEGYTTNGGYIFNGNIQSDNFNITNESGILYAGVYSEEGISVNTITLSSNNANSTGSCKQKVYDFIIYDRVLSDEEIAYNYKVSQQLNGIE